MSSSLYFYHYSIYEIKSAYKVYKSSHLNTPTDTSPKLDPGINCYNNTEKFFVYDIAQVNLKFENS